MKYFFTTIIFLFFFLLGQTQQQIQILKDSVLYPTFGGLGFHSFHHCFNVNERQWNENIYKRWRELSPSFVRLNHFNSWNNQKIQNVIKHFSEFQKTKTEIYLTTWDPRNESSIDSIKKYAHQIVDQLEYFIKYCKFGNIKYYCLTNEMSFSVWGDMIGDLDRYKLYQNSIYQELKNRKISLGILSTDASPISNWYTIKWALSNMNHITDFYGGHHYFNDFNLLDTTFYSWFSNQLLSVTKPVNALGKKFIIGEFGVKANPSTIDGVRIDACIYNDTPEEPLVGIQLAEAMLAGINNGVYAMGYWTFVDLPYPEAYGNNYKNEWGIFKFGGNFSPRKYYYPTALLTKYFKGNAQVIQVKSNDPLVRAAAIKSETGKWTFAFVNRHTGNIPISINLGQENVLLKKMVFDPANPPQLDFGDLPPADSLIKVNNGNFATLLPSTSFTLFTSDFDTIRPNIVNDLITEKLSNGFNKTTWAENVDSDFCYYRIYRSNNPSFNWDKAIQVGSTIATNFIDTAVATNATYTYKIIAIDNSGNASEIVKSLTSNLKVEKMSLSLYPNPTTNKSFKISLLNIVKGSYSVRLISATGKILEDKKVDLNNGDTTINFNFGSYITSGSYFVELYSINDKKRVLSKMLLINSKN